MPKRPRRLRHRRPPLTEELILAWADYQHEQTGQWPTCMMEAVAGQLGEKWCNIDQALRAGHRGLPGGSSLPQLLAELRGVRNIGGLAPLTEAEIEVWARAHQARTGHWPTEMTLSLIPESPGDTWADIAMAVEHGSRGLPQGGSLSGLLSRRAGTRNIQALPRLTIKNIVAWAVHHRRQKGEWPRVLSGQVEAAPAETWLGIDSALREGLRGLKGGSSLLQVLARYCNARNKAALPPLKMEKIEQWIDAHRRRTGEWPTQYSGPIPRSGGESWGGVQLAMRAGMRGLPGGDSIHQLLIRTGRKTEETRSPAVSSPDGTEAPTHG